MDNEETGCPQCGDPSDHTETSNVIPFDVNMIASPADPDAPKETPPPGVRIEISIAELQQRKLFLAAPMYGGQCAGMFTRSVQALTELCTQYGIKLVVHYLFNESLITRARNYCMDEFMRSGCTHMMFIDSDIGFNANDVIGLLAMQSDDSPYDVIGGPYPKKCIAWEKIKMAVDKGFADEDPNRLENFVGDYVFNPKAGTTQIPLAQPVEVLEIGTGFMMIRRKTLEKFVEAFPHYYYRPDHVRTKHFDGSREIMMFFQAEIDQLDFGTYYENELRRIQNSANMTSEELVKEIDAIFKKAKELNSKRSKRYLSEDYWFCQKLQEIGLKTWICPWMKLAHVGTMIFGGSLIDLAQLGASATADPSKLGGK